MVDALTQLPIEGARALIPSSRRVFRPAEFAAETIEAEARSDARGRFALPVHTALGLGLACLVADGYGAQAFACDEAHDVPERAQRLELLPAATLELVLLDELRRALPEVEVALSCPGDDMDFGRMFVETSAEWSARTDAEGRARFAELPAESLLEWSVSGTHDDTARSDRVALGPGELRVVTVILGAGARLTGTVRDQDGVPVPELELWLVRPSEELRLYSNRALVATCRSDERGRFELRDLPYEAFVLGPAPEQADFVPRGQPVRIERAEDELELVVTRGLAIEGAVLGSAEQLAEVNWVTALSCDDGDSADSELDGQGRFRIAPLLPGEYLVYGFALQGGTEIARVSAGARGVELHLVEPRSIPVHVLGSTRGFVFHAQDLERGSAVSTEGQAPDFRWTFAPGTYALVVTAKDGRLGFQRTVIAASAPSELSLELHEPARVTLVNRATSGFGALRLTLEGERFPLSLFSRTAREGLLAGAAETLLLPAGHLRAELVEGGRVVAAQELALLPGERRRIELAPR